MHVQIDRAVGSTGLFTKKTHYHVKCVITFSEEEKAIIKKHGLGSSYAVYYEFDSYGVKATRGWDFDKIAKGQPVERNFDYVTDADEWEKELKEMRLPAVKSVLDKHKSAGSGTGSSSFEI